MAKFTFITDFKGGTYISQHAGNDIRSACTEWKNHVVEDKPFKDALDVVQFAEAFDFYLVEVPPLALNALENVWNFGFCAMRNKVIGINIIQTDTSPIEVGSEFINS